MKIFISLLSAGFLSSCVPGIIHAGKDFDIKQAEALQPRLSTLAEAKSLVGEPYATETDAEGNILVKWEYAHNDFIGESMKGIAILFSKDGKMIRVTKEIKP